MNSNIGFVFDQPGTYPPSCQYQMVNHAAPQFPPPGILNMCYPEPPCPSPLPAHHVAYNAMPFPSAVNSCPVYGDQGKFSGYGETVQQHQHLGPYQTQSEGVMTGGDLHGRGGPHGNGIPGGMFGVVGGAAAAGAGTALAMQLLPKKLKKNKLVKYGLPIAGASAAGYKLNQMNNQGKY